MHASMYILLQAGAPTSLRSCPVRLRPRAYIVIAALWIVSPRSLSLSLSRVYVHPFQLNAVSLTPLRGSFHSAHFAVFDVRRLRSFLHFSCLLPVREIERSIIPDACHFLFFWVTKTSFWSGKKSALISLFLFAVVGVCSKKYPTSKRTLACIGVVLISNVFYVLAKLFRMTFMRELMWCVWFEFERRFTFNYRECSSGITRD